MRMLNLQELRACATAAGNQGLPHAEWLFIRDARSLLGAGQNRRAVIDACTAAELSVTALIDRKFDQLGTSKTDRDQELNTHHGLQRLIQLNNRVGASTLPRRLQQDVAEPRNRAAHQGEQSSEPEARAAILKATEVVEMAYPLGSLMAAQTVRGAPHDTAGNTATPTESALYRPTTGKPETRASRPINALHAAYLKVWQYLSSSSH
jgi:hypothetical protein